LYDKVYLDLFYSVPEGARCLESGAGMQLDLFEGGGAVSVLSERTQNALIPLDITALSDAALLDAIPNAGLPSVLSLIDEAGRRKLPDAIPVLTHLCRMFTGFGIKYAISEQTAAIRAIGTIGGKEANQALSRMLDQQVLQGPNLKQGARLAATLHCRLSTETLLGLLRHDDPEVRCCGCDLARPHADINTVLIDLMTDLNVEVRTQAACALGRFGKQEASGVLKACLQQAPTEKIIEALASLGDSDSLIRLGRLAGARPDLTEVIIEALTALDDPVADKIVRDLMSGDAAQQS
jgi:hypothetical protein